MTLSQFPLSCETPKHEYRLPPNARLVQNFCHSDNLLLPAAHARESRKRIRSQRASLASYENPVSENDLGLSDMDTASLASAFSQLVVPMFPRLTSSAIQSESNSVPVSSHTLVQDQCISTDGSRLTLCSRDGGALNPAKRRLTSVSSSIDSSSILHVQHPQTGQMPLQLHQKANILINSPTRTPISDYEEDEAANQLPLPSPSMSPSQDSLYKHVFPETVSELHLGTPQTQQELVSYISDLAQHLDPRGHNYLIYRLLQRVNRSTLSTFNGLIHNLLRRDLLSDLPRELAIRILQYLDHKTLLTLALVCKKWCSIINNASLWLNLLGRDKLITCTEELEKELLDSLALLRDWGAPYSFIPASAAQVLYKKRRIIYQRWMDPNFLPKRITVTGHASKVVTCLQHDDDKIITGLEGRPISIYSTRTGRLLRVLEGHEGGVWAMKYIGNTLVTGSTDRTVRIWNISTGKCTHIFRGHTLTVRCLEIITPAIIGKDPEGKDIVYPAEPLLVTGSRDHNLHVWKLPLCEIASVNDDQDSNTRPYDSGEDAVNPYLVTILTGHIQLVRSVTGHGNIVISGSYDSTVRVWDLLQGGVCKHVLTGHHDKVYSMVMDYTSKICYSASMDSTINIWNFETGRLLQTLEGHTSLVGLLDLVDGVLVSAAADFSLRIWDPKTGKNYSKLEGHASPITCFEHDGLRVVSGSERMLKLWNTTTGAFTRDLLTDVSGGIWQVRIDYRRCVAAVQRYTNDNDYDTFIEILDFSELP